MACPTLPTGKVREILKRTEKTGREHGFAVCADGSTSEIQSGGKTNLDIGDAIESCNLDKGPVSVVHTHPNGVKDLSDPDRKVAAHEDIESVCVAVSGGETKCESVDTCEREINV